MPDDLTSTMAYRRDLPESIGDNYSRVELGPIDSSNNQRKRYTFPSPKAAERFAAVARSRHPGREVRVT